MKAGLLGQLQERGYRGRIASIQRLHDLEGGIKIPYKDSLFDQAFYQERLTGFDFSPPENLPQARSLIVVAIKQPQIRFTFNWNGKQIPIIVPPTYLCWQETDKRAELALVEILASEGYRVAQAALPKKLLAVRSGLAVYGRNNITYIDGLGSFYRLAAFYSDLPCDRDDWQEPKMMERCKTCLACLQKCPTGAITRERFLLHAERCIVFHNEKPGHVPFPTWLPLSAHNCLVGCLDCQRICPENRDFLAWMEQGAAFSSQETALLLDGVPLDELPSTTARKLKRWDLVDLLDILPRNLAVLLKGKSTTKL